MTVGNAKTILVVDDDPGILALVELVLTDEGYRVRTALDGRKGLQIVEGSMPDLILLDLKMPGMNGWEFARRFHDEYGCQVPIVALTASSNCKEQIDELGAVDKISKPFDLSDLLGIVNRYAAHNL